MKNKDHIVIKHLLENKHKELNISNIAKSLKIDYKNLYNIIKRLAEKEIISILQFGNSKKIILRESIKTVIPREWDFQ